MRFADGPIYIKEQLTKSRGDKVSGLKIFVCSPLRASAEYTFEENVKLVHRLCKAVIDAGHFPYAPHAYLPLFLDDNVEKERWAGINTGKAFLGQCDELWAYAATYDQCSTGMKHEIDFCKTLFVPTRVIYMPPAFDSVIPRVKTLSP